MKAISIEDEMDKFKSHLAKMSILNSQLNLISYQKFIYN